MCALCVYIVTFTINPSVLLLVQAVTVVKTEEEKKKSSGASVFCKRLVSLNLFYFYGFLNNCVNWTLLSCSAVFPQLSLAPVFFFKQLMLTKFWSILTCDLLLKAWLKAEKKSRHPETVPHLIILKEGND